MDSLQQQVLQLIRKFRKGWCQLLERERMTICGADNMLMLLQLAIAEINKVSYGEFSVTLSELLLSWKHLLREKLELLSELDVAPDGYQRVRETYEAFLSKNNSVDLIDVYKICAKLKPESDPAAILSKMELLNFLLGTAKPSENSLSPVPTSPANESHQTIAKLALVLRKLLCDYLHLLVNSKSDLALACIFNVPERGFGKTAFTDLRHAARDKQTSLYLAATSFVRCLELGGKSYAPSDKDPLMQHVKGLLDLVHFIDKLQEIIGETPDSSVAAGQILSCIKRRLLKGKSSKSSFCLATEEVSEDLTMRINNVVNHQHDCTDEMMTDISPAQPKVYAINHATAYGGRRTVKALIALLDEEAAQPPSEGKAELLYGTEQHDSIFGVPCMLTLFRSPTQSSGLLSKPLCHRIQKRIQKESLAKVKHTLIKSQFSCTYKEESAAKIKHCNDLSFDQTPTGVQPVPRPAVTIFCDDESIEAGSSQILPPSAGQLELPRKRGHEAILGKARNEEGGNRKGSRKVSKRKCMEFDNDMGCENELPTCPPASLESKMGKTTKTVRTKAKNKLIAGQSKLTNFFRV
ncbi:PCNA-interacting partner [Hemiscyllium ocellatum]|uniref:PCNA-interacting partner n=1 Tax=Hemiscyllium ocellatum TaxID=170820 RepID=UPI002966E2BF|nr:PCNA-interacting partner [Hemiscyllium ocellatum]XP_060695180.1 PCNA-interacting partner [Hemiscyllium ocellatum]XP_060695181.1 PCNA-interacting partner [Hemiscyllium ocellatum]